MKEDPTFAWEASSNPLTPPVTVTYIFWKQLPSFNSTKQSSFDYCLVLFVHPPILIVCPMNSSWLYHSLATLTLVPYAIEATTFFGTMSFLSKIPVYGWKGPSSFTEAVVDSGVSGVGSWWADSFTI